MWHGEDFEQSAPNHRVLAVVLHEQEQKTSDSEGMVEVQCPARGAHAVIEDEDPDGQCW